MSNLAKQWNDTLSSMGLDRSDWRRLVCYTRCDDEPIISMEEVPTPETCYYINGHVVKRKDDGKIFWVSWTIANGRHVKNSVVWLAPDASRVLSFEYNTFSFGWRSVDVEDAEDDIDYIQEMLQEMQQRHDKWDVIE